MSEKTAIGYARELVASLWHSFPEDAEQPIAEAIAAAEERGRRRGVEEAAKWLRDNFECSAEAAEDLCAALAPRDSVPARYCDEPHPSKPLKCGRFVQHNGPHTAFTPGFDSENRRAVHWEPRDSGKEG